MSGSLIFWRHGQTAYNIERRFQGHIDIPLNETGKRQAKAAAGLLAEERPVRIISSDLSRARDTAAELGRLSGVPVAPDARLRERCYGQWEGLKIEEITERFPDDAARWRHGLDPLGAGVESRRTAASRAIEVVRQYEQDASDGAIVFVSHGGLITCVIAALLGQDPSAWLGLKGLDNCHWAKLATNPGRVPRWRLAAYNHFPA